MKLHRTDIYLEKEKRERETTNCIARVASIHTATSYFRLCLHTDFRLGGFEQYRIRGEILSGTISHAAESERSKGQSRYVHKTCEIESTDIPRDVAERFRSRQRAEVKARRNRR